jgi:hypothetical protein
LFYGDRWQERFEQSLKTWRRRRAPSLTRHERLQAAADAGVDTWEDYRGEK